MCLRTILVPLLGGAEDGAALSAAVTLAERFAAHLDALFVAPDPKESVLVLGDGLSTLMVDDIMRASQTMCHDRRKAAWATYGAAIAAAGDRLTAVMDPEALGRATTRWREVTGRAEERVIAAGRLSDLVLFHHGGGQPDVRYQQAIEAALLFSGRPVLLAPAGPLPSSAVVTVAWNGKCEAARALAAARPFLKRAERVHILTVTGGELEADEPARLVEALAWHGITAEPVAVDAEAGSVGATLLRHAAALGSGLLVMGGYGHGRVRELILGGATRHVLTHPGGPVLLAH